MVKNLPANAGDARDPGLILGLRRSPRVVNGNPLQYSCLGTFHGQRSLAGLSPWHCKESDMTEHALLSHFSRVRPCATHRPQPTRLPHPWDSQGKNTGVGCHFLLQCMKVKSEKEVTQSCPTLRDPMDCSPPGSSIRGIFQARVLEWGAIAFSRACTHNKIKKLKNKLPPGRR